MAEINKTRAIYSFVEIDPTTKQILPETIFGLDVVSTINFNSPNAIVTYETVGGDGGYSISTGRLTQTVTINARFISNIVYGIGGNLDVNGKVVSNSRDPLNENFQKLNKLKNLRRPVYIHKLTYGNGQKFFGRYLIKNVSGGIEEADKTIMVKIDLVEYKSLDVKQNVIVGEDIISSENVDNLATHIESRNK